MQFFKYTSQQRIGILLLFTVIVGLQLAYFFIEINIQDDNNIEAKKEWLSFQKEIDSLKYQKANTKETIFPFNPNFITDHKGYRLGMSIAEIDRLLEFRKTNKFVNSAQEFQYVTKISDTLLNKISPYFKFPEWVINKTKKENFASNIDKKEKTIVVDINKATQEDLIKIYGIGPALSERILSKRKLLGAYVSMDQMYDVYGLSEEVIQKLKLNFNVSDRSEIKKYNINNASIKELSQFPYFRYSLAKEIVTHRSMKGDIKKIEDLVEINEFPVDKLKIITLYLEF
ncbi:ComEA family DNA-binding protein [Flavobacterium sp. '19STA2R22 D10 B1']|uniref:ComEA family DNA-binding protein n=1 Tax=Flavobacterium aerium TaxID=3037261 RepID=UPI00278C1DCF|nr:helix-hairpin-helix domain-containing protein [Flavobacterium sp. '19STA2R22 D10 B1']